MKKRKISKAQYSQAGKIGGAKTLELYGNKHFILAGQKSGEARRAKRDAKKEKVFLPPTLDDLA